MGPGSAVTHVLDQIARIALTWLPLLMICLIVYLLWRMVQLMPRVKPAQIQPGSKTSVKWGEVAGLEEVKAELQEVVEFLRDPKRFERLGARVPKGILLYGPPGTGKTLLAKAVAHESGASFYSQSALANAARRIPHFTFGRLLARNVATMSPQMSPLMSPPGGPSQRPQSQCCSQTRALQTLRTFNPKVPGPTLLE